MPKIDRIKTALLDTHVWVWSVAGDPRAAMLRNFCGVAFVSAISVWEVAMLEAKGRLQLKPDVETWVRDNLRPPVELEPLTPEVSILSTRLENFHGDPADRMIVATAMICGFPLITADQKMVDWSRASGKLQVMELI